MSDKLLVSIIIPIYNAEAFIGRALDSCMRQSFKDFELILVNDGSKDRSLDVINEYHASHSEVASCLKLMDISNSGVVKAREYGVKAAAGEYVLFMDADDELADGVLQKMVDALAPEVDMVIGDINQIEFDGSSSVIRYGHAGCVTGKEHFDWIVREHVGFLWGKLIRKSLVVSFKVMPYGVKFCEDYIQMLQISYNARKVVHIEEVTYNYIQQEASACNKALPVKEYTQRFADLCKKINEIIEICGFDDESNIKLKVLFLYYCRLYLLSSGKWYPNNYLRQKFNQYLQENKVKAFFAETDRKRYWMIKTVKYLYIVLSAIYIKQLRKWGRII